MHEYPTIEVLPRRRYTHYTDAVPGIFIAKDYIDRAALCERPDGPRSWGVLFDPTQEQIDAYTYLVGEYAGILAGIMHNEGFSGEAIQCATGWMFKRLKDRIGINADSYNRALGGLAPLSLLQPSLDGRASVAEMLLLRSSKTMENIELGRVTAPDLRQEVLVAMHESLEQACEILGGVHLDKPDKLEEVERQVLHRDNGGTLRRIHHKEYLFQLPDETMVVTRRAIIIRTTGRFILEKMQLDDVLESPHVIQSEIAYAYNTNKAVNEFYASVR